MNKMQTQVREFHEAFGVPVNTKPVVSIDPKRLELRAKLILEEALETIFAMGLIIDDIDLLTFKPRKNYAMNLAEIADGLTDLKYVTFGADIELGLDAEKCFDEVHRSNMSKAWKGDSVVECISKGNPDRLSFRRIATGRSIAKRPDGKIIKGPDYEKADLSSVISKQMRETLD